MKSGVYFLMRRKKVVYIGATRNWPLRLSQHKEIPFDSSRIIECSIDVVYEYERRWIMLFKPSDNYRHNKPTKRYPIYDWVEQNLEYVRKSFESSETYLDCVKVAHKTLGYSPKTNCEDLAWVVVRKYCKITNMRFDPRAYRFYEKETKELV